MSELEEPNSVTQVSPQPPRTWDFAETTLVALIAYAVYGLASGLTLSLLLAMHDGATTMSAAQREAWSAQGQWDGTALIVASALTVAVLWIAIRMAHRDFADYLALNWPTSGQFGRALGIMLLILLVESMSSAMLGGEGASAGPYVSARQAGGLLIFMIAGCIAAPV